MAPIPAHNCLSIAQIGRAGEVGHLKAGQGSTGLDELIGATGAYAPSSRMAWRQRRPYEEGLCGSRHPMTKVARHASEQLRHAAHSAGRSAANLSDLKSGRVEGD